ncbi:head-tail adaptor protein [Maritimibacter alkaliphilus]|uniref:head-tail adaptor protein n=1 Tax=Maritimibacter alkaliphilus TaxID=404236 RepID=UPI001C97FFC2|nr:head-tail adaptor protein [Maritimibacter alkaliphilus]MBY6090277.1 head-tail adaptor protein [Maritimibacter alkaliphilus]
MIPRLNRALQLETAQRIADGAGGFSEVWQGLGTVWAEVSARGAGRERGGEALPLGQVGWRIVVRGAAQGDPVRPQAGQRFREGARVYRILAVAERDPAGRYLTCFASEEAVA